MGHSSTRTTSSMHILLLRRDEKMNQTAVLFLACILAGYALIKLALWAPFLASLATILVIVGGIAILVFGLAILYLGVKALTKL
jgi:hypothetical protein